jgi:hypothetical protein
MSGTTDEFGVAVSILHEVLAEFRSQVDAFAVSNRELTGELRKLIEVLGATRTASIELPSGVKATLTSEKEH